MCKKNGECTCAEPCQPKADVKEYEIKTFNDFMKVPAENLDNCLRDFTSFVKFNHGMIDVLKAFIEGSITDETDPMSDEDRAELKVLMKNGMVASVESFKWIDDGEPGCSGFEINLYTDDENGEPFLFENIKMDVNDVDDI